MQGDVGEASAIEWLTSKGALVWVPIGHSPDVDLLADLGARTLRIQVKTTTYAVKTPKGFDRWVVSLTTSGGNQSWTGAHKPLDPNRIDRLFVLVGDGRRWLIPSNALEACRAISLGGAKYSEFEIEPGTPMTPLVFGDWDPNRIDSPLLGECQSGQMEQTVNLPAMPTEVRILSPPSARTGRSCQVLFRPKRQATIPRRPCEEAGLEAGDRLRVRADGPGRILLEKIVRR